MDGGANMDFFFLTYHLSFKIHPRLALLERWNFVSCFCGEDFNIMSFFVSY